VPLILLVVLLPIIVIALTPLLLVQRYRVATTRKPARKWMVTLALVSTSVSAVMLLIGAAFTNVWMSDTFGDAALGLVIGCAAGVAGLLLTRWEPLPGSFHYTQNRLAVLLITLVVAGRVVFGLYRSILAVRAGLSGAAALGAFGVPYSLGAGGIVLGYALAYNAGVHWRIRRWEQRRLRVIGK
jgi:hypothetical protein